MADSDSLGQSLAAEASGTSEKPAEANQTVETGAEKTDGADARFVGKDGKLDADKLHKSYKELEKRLGASVVIPKSDAKPEEWSSFYKRLGRPEKPEEYELEDIFLPDGVTKADFGEEDFKKAAFELGFSKDQAKKLHKWAVNQSMEIAKQQRAKFEARKTESSDALRKEYGEKYKEKLANVAMVSRKFGSEEWTQYLNEGAGNDPRLLRVLIKIGDAMSEDTLERGNGPAPKEQAEGVERYPNSPGMTGNNRFRSVR